MPDGIKKWKFNQPVWIRTVNLVKIGSEDENITINNIVFTSLFLCLIPGNDISKIDFLKITYEDKVVHLIMFFGFSSMLFLDLKRNTELAGKKAALSLIVAVRIFYLEMTVGIENFNLKLLTSPFRGTECL